MDVNKDKSASDNKIDRLSRLVRLSNALIEDPRLETLSDIISKECAAMVSAQESFLFVLDENTGKLCAMLFPAAKRIELDRGEGLEGWVASSGEYVISDNPADDSRFSEKLQKALGRKIENAIIVPFVGKRNEVFGVIEAINRSDGNFTSTDFYLLRAAVAEIAINLENAKLYNDLKETFNSLVEVMAATIDAKHPISKEHSRRVATYAVGIAREMGLPDNEIEQIRIASLLHDYGKIGIDDSILKKEGPLTDEEFEIMKGHAKITHDIVSKVHFNKELSDVPTIASCHHERWDGKGYPFGMAGEAIPLGSRIIAVADVFDATTTIREYKSAKSFDEAAKEIVAGSGTQFDPKVIHAFERYYTKELRTIASKKSDR